MKHVKQFLVLSFMTAALLTACSDTKTTTEETKTTTTTVKDSQTKPTDTLPPIDTTAKGKPDNANTQ